METDERPPGSSADAVLALIRRVGGLAPQVAFERSFKLSAGRVSADRLLLGVPRADGNPQHDAGVIETCRALAMPVDLAQALERDLAGANHVYFGAERDADTLTFKAYLEYRETILSRAPAARDAAAGLLYVGYKWDPASATRRAISRYDWQIGLPPAPMEQRVRAMLAAEHLSGLAELAGRLVADVTRGCDPEALQYLEVSEAGNPRQSFDVKVYKAGLHVHDIAAHLRAAQALFRLSDGALDHLMGRVGSDRLGHVAAGVDRQGRGFLNVYHGGLTLDADRLVRAQRAGGSG